MGPENSSQNYLTGLEGALYFLRCGNGKPTSSGVGDAWVVPHLLSPLVAFAPCCCVAASGIPGIEIEIVMEERLTLLCHQHGLCLGPSVG